MVYIAALDLGTTGCRTFIFDVSGSIIASDYQEWERMCFPGSMARHRNHRFSPYLHVLGHSLDRLSRTNSGKLPHNLLLIVTSFGKCAPQCPSKSLILFPHINLS